MAGSSTVSANLAQSQRVQDIYIEALRNTHALLKQAEDMLERQIERYEQYPALTQVLRQHRAEIPGQIQKFEEILHSHGEDRSILKDFVTQTVGNIGAAIHSLASDEVLKNIYTDHALERHEVAAFTSLIAIAEAAGKTQHVPTFEQFRQTHERAGELVLQQVRPVTLRHLEIEASEGAHAGKR